MSWWIRRAADLQARGRASDAESQDQYSPEQAVRAVVYTREDMTMLVSLLDSANQQLATMNNAIRQLQVLVALAFGLAFYLGLRA